MDIFLAPSQNDFLPKPEHTVVISQPAICPFLGFPPGERSSLKYSALTSRFSAPNGSSKYSSLISFDGVVIRIDDIKTFSPKNSGFLNIIHYPGCLSFPMFIDPSITSALQRFIIRTSIDHWAAVTCWGPPGYLKEMTDDLHVGDTVSVRNARSKLLPEFSKLSETSAGKISTDPRVWMPSLSSDVVYDIESDKSGQIVLLIRQNMREEILEIVRTPPLLNTGNIFPLGLLEANQASLIGKYVSFVGIVKEVGRDFFIKTKQGSRVHRITLRVFDKDCSGLNVTLWGKEYAYMAKRFVPLHTILLFTEILISMDNRNGLPALLSSTKTLLTLYPLMAAAEILVSFLAMLDSTAVRPIVPERSSFSYFNCRSAREAMQSAPKSPGLVFAGRVRCYLTFFDLDGPLDHVVTYRCSACRVKAPNQRPSVNIYDDLPWHCDNSFCPLFGALVQPSYEILCNFSDGSGSLNNVRLVEHHAETVVGLKAEEFLAISSEARTALKWKRLFEVADIALVIISSEVDVFRKDLELIHVEFV